VRKSLLALCFLGIAAPYAAFLPWVAENGLDLGLFAEQMLANPISTFFVLDVLVSAGVVVLLAARGLRRGDLRMVWPIVGTLTVGVSLGLPLYLYIESGADASSAKRPTDPV
jgi:hypothetical protein